MKFRSFLRNLAVGSDTTPRLRRPSWMTGESARPHGLEGDGSTERPTLSRKACAEGDQPSEKFGD